MKILEQLLARKLLDIKAIKLRFSNPFTLTSGWKSPIYCDNRKILSYPSIRNFIKLELARTILENYENVDTIAGIATGAIAHGAIVAEELNLPFIYIRSNYKNHGLKNIIEGDLKPNTKVVIIEDLISTGTSSMLAIKAVRNAECHVIGIVAIFTYGFFIAEEKFKKAKVGLITLCNYDSVLKEALKTNFIKLSEAKILQEWKKNPSKWA
ncbi:MAG: orotate phosphoribosyltransferase [Bacteroidales bacterium OttesenSCG-928-I14]|jgi:orotate phosphoribosyltransferase|nr:orotate phosphoribosyltransferase [Bacteroidales bacterium OttesenSCG-928-I14]